MGWETDCGRERGDVGVHKYVKTMMQVPGDMEDGEG